MMEPKWTLEDGLILRGQTALYRATGDARYRDFVLDYMEKGVAPDGRTLPGASMACPPHGLAACGNALLFALDETGEARYRNALDIIVSHVEADPPPEWPWELYGTMPFMAEYDTRFGGRKAYKTIARQFREESDRLFDREKGLYHAQDLRPNVSPGYTLRDEGSMLMALVDTVENMDMQIYEHWRTLADLFLEAARGIVRWQNRESGLWHSVIDQTETETDWSGNAMVIYALAKGAWLGLLDEEKYLPPTRRAYARLAEHMSGEPENGDAWTMGPVMMAQEEMGRVER